MTDEPATPPTMIWHLTMTASGAVHDKDGNLLSGEPVETSGTNEQEGDSQ